MSVPIIYVGRLNTVTSATTIGKLFEQFGDVVNATIDTRDGRSLGRGYVQMARSQAAYEAVAQLNNAEVDGSRIRVEITNNQEAALRVLSGRSDNPPPPPPRQQRYSPSTVQRPTPAPSRRTQPPLQATGSRPPRGGAASSFAPYRPSRASDFARSYVQPPTLIEPAPPRQPRRAPRRGRQGQDLSQRTPGQSDSSMNFGYPMPDASTAQQLRQLQQQISQLNSVLSEFQQFKAELEMLRKEALPASQQQPAPASKRAARQPRRAQTATPATPASTASAAPRASAPAATPAPATTGRRGTRRTRGVDPSVPTRPNVVCVRRIPPTLTQQGLADLAKGYSVAKVELPISRFNLKQNIGHGFIEFSNATEQQRFLSEHPTIQVENRTCIVEPAIDLEKVRAGNSTR